VRTRHRTVSLESDQLLPWVGAQCGSLSTRRQHRLNTVPAPSCADSYTVIISLSSCPSSLSGSSQCAHGPCVEDLTSTKYMWMYMNGGMCSYLNESKEPNIQQRQPTCRPAILLGMCTVGAYSLQVQVPGRCHNRDIAFVPPNGRTGFLADCTQNAGATNGRQFQVFNY
jgi:hypothetical protein